MASPRKMLVIDGKMAVNNGRMVTTDAADCCCGGETEPDPFTVVVRATETFDENRDEFDLSSGIKTLEGRYRRVFQIEYIARVTYTPEGIQMNDVAPGAATLIQTSGYRKLWNAAGTLVSDISQNGLYTATVIKPTGYSTGNGNQLSASIAIATCAKPTAAGCTAFGLEEIPPQSNGWIEYSETGNIHQTTNPSGRRYSLYGTELRCPDGTWSGTKTAASGFPFDFTQVDTWDAQVSANSYRITSSQTQIRTREPTGKVIDLRVDLSLSFVAGPGFDCGPGGLLIPSPIPSAADARRRLDEYFGRMA